MQNPPQWAGSQVLKGKVFTCGAILVIAPFQPILRAHLVRLFAAGADFALTVVTGWAGAALGLAGADFCIWSNMNAFRWF